MTVIRVFGDMWICSVSSKANCGMCLLQDMVVCTKPLTIDASQQFLLIPRWINNSSRPHNYQESSFHLSLKIVYLLCVIYMTVGLDNTGGVVTRYGLGSPGIEPWQRRDFPHPSRPALRTTQTPAQWLPGLSSGGKAAGTCRPSSAEVKDRVQLRGLFK